MRRSELRHTLSLMLATCIVALIVGCAGLGLAVRAGVAPPFELWLTPDDRHVLVVRNGPACLPDLLRIACIAGVTRREFRVVYVSQLTHWGLLSFAVSSY